MRTAILVTLLAVSVPSPAATPPDLLNYQGVLRDASGRPLDGSFDVVFRFFSAGAAGDEILVDAHDAANGNAVSVSGGLFNAALGGGAVGDGSGPGTYSTLAEVFGEYSEVWLAVEVNGEPLLPRLRVLAAAYSLNASRLDGRDSNDFLDTSQTAQTKSGPLVVDSSAIASTIGIEALGSAVGGYFESAASGSYGYIGSGGTGVTGYGSTQGAYFDDLDSSGHAALGVGDHGIQASGNFMGGYFTDGDQSGAAMVGYGDWGVVGKGNVAGGLFEDLDSSGTAYVGYGDRGIYAYSDTLGGEFRASGHSGTARVAWVDVGIDAVGDTTGGQFRDSNSSAIAYLGNGDYGIRAYGDFVGGLFADSNGSGYSRVGYGDTGIQGYGNASGGYFEDLNSSGWTQVGVSTYKISGSGAVSFVQNHPERADRVIVYHAPEASEVAVYTRGSARLAYGSARIALDPTFAWTANPDLGLTANVTPRGACPSLHVESVSTSELAVRCDDASGADLAIDYIVWGLRIGFEESSVVQEKEREAYIPSMADHHERYDRLPELRRFSALERFKGMEAAVAGTEAVALDLSRSSALIASIGKYDPRVHGTIATGDTESESTIPRAEEPAGPLPPAPTESVDRTGDEGTGAGALPSTEIHAVSETVEAGDVLVLDRDDPRALRLGREPADPGVVGIVALAAWLPHEDRAPIALHGTVRCKVDAGYGPIRAGDLLTTSRSPGHAMRAVDAPAGSVLGKALEPLEYGQGTIRVLVMMR